MMLASIPFPMKRYMLNPPDLSDEPLAVVSFASEGMAV